MKAFCVNVVVHGQSGGAMPSAKCFCDGEKAATDEAQRMNDRVTAIFEFGRVVMAQPNGPPKMVCSAKELLGMLGIVGISHMTTSGEMKGSIEVPSSSIIIPKN